MKNLLLYGISFIIMQVNLSLHTFNMPQFKTSDTLTIASPGNSHIGRQIINSIKFRYDIAMYNKLVYTLKHYEGFSDTIYPGLAGDTLIGYGHLLSKQEKIKFKNGINRYQADSIFNEDIGQALAYTYKFTQLTGNKLLSVSSFVFNVGIGYFLRSELNKKLKTSNYKEITNEWKKYCYHKVWFYNKSKKRLEFYYTNSEILLERRNLEIKLYFS